MNTRISPLEYSDLHRFFRELWEQSRKHNRRMSQAALARLLGCSAPTWTNFINGRRMFSDQMLFTIGQRLNWSADELSHALNLRALQSKNVDPEKTQPLRARAAKRVRLSKRPLKDRNAPHAELNLLSVALMEGVKLPEYRKDPLRIAERLGLKPQNARSSLEQLLKAEIIEKLPDGSYAATAQSHLLVSGGSSQSLRKYYREMLDLAARRIQPDTASERYVGSETFAFDPSLLPEARKIIDRCLDDLFTLAGTSSAPRTVYHAGVQLFEILEKKTS